MDKENSKKILIVDDDSHIVELLSSRLEANNYNVIAAMDGVQAIRLAYADKPDLIILDIRMPAGDGVTVYENLKAAGSDVAIPVIFITAYPSEDIRRKVLEMGAKDFIAKPFDIDDLLVKVKKALAESE